MINIKERILNKPIQITLDITDRCQMRCITCKKWHTKHADVIHKEFSTQEWKDIILKLRTWLGAGFSLFFSGGEPFLREDIFELIEYASSLNVCSMSLTNAFSISHLYERIIDSNLKSINISLNSIQNPIIHDNSRGRDGSFQKCVDSLLKLNELKKRKGRKIAILISSIILPDNIYELVPLVEFVKEQKLNGIYFQLFEDAESFRAYDARKELNTSEYKLPDNLYRTYMSMSEEIIPVIDELIEMKNKKYPIYNSEEQLEAFKTFFRNPSKILETIICDVGSTNFSIDPYGDVRLCFNMNPVASIKDTSPQDIWENAKSEACRNATKSCKMYCRILDCNFKKINSQYLANRVRKILIDLNRIKQ
jgi:MoaA/NifB/PqqE/SkfB family radical SAM enzyme